MFWFEECSAVDYINTTSQPAESITSKRMQFGLSQYIWFEVFGAEMRHHTGDRAIVQEKIRNFCATDTLRTSIASRIVAAALRRSVWVDLATLLELICGFRGGPLPCSESASLSSLEFSERN